MLAATGIAAVTLASGAAPALVRPTPPAALALAGKPVEVVVALRQPPLARAFAQQRTLQSLSTRRGPPRRARAGRARLHAHARGRAAHARGADRPRAARRDRPLALPGRARRARRRRPEGTGGAARARARRRPRLPVRPLPRARELEPGDDRRAAALGRQPRDRRPGREDRDRRRRRRRAAPLPRPRGPDDAGRLPARAAGVHEREGDRRALVRAAEPELEVRRAALRPPVLRARHARRGDRGRRPRHHRRPRPRARHRQGPLGRRADGVPRQLPRAHDPDRVRRRAQRQHAPRSRPGSRRPSATGWT